MKHYSAIIFDLDGTLYNNAHLPFQLVTSNPSKALWMLSERIARKRLAGREFDSEDLLYAEMFRQIGKTHRSSINAAEQWYKTSYMPTMVRLIGEKHPKYDWVLPLIEILRNRKCKLAVFSDYGFVHEKLAALGIDESLFDIIVDGPSLGGLKPCKRSFMRVVEMLGSTTQTTLMFGDRESTDGEGCRQVGIDFINVKKTDMNKLLIEL